jgi:hypothetical protein
MVTSNVDDAPAGAGPGISFTSDPGGSTPREVPGAADGPPPRTPPPRATAPGATPVVVPLSAPIVKFPILTVSHAVAEVTGYPGWNFTEDEANALADAIAELGYQVPPWANAMLLAVGIVAGKTISYAIWKRRGGSPVSLDNPELPEPVEYVPENPYAANGL